MVFSAHTQDPWIDDAWWILKEARRPAPKETETQPKYPDPKDVPPWEKEPECVEVAGPDYGELHQIAETVEFDQSELIKEYEEPSLDRTEPEPLGIDPLTSLPRHHISEVEDDNAVVLDPVSRVFLVLLSGAQLELHEVDQTITNSRLDYLYKQTNEGKLALYGTLNDNNRGFLIVLADSVEGVRECVESDPLIRTGYYQQYEIVEVITHQTTGPSSGVVVQTGHERPL